MRDDYIKRVENYLKNFIQNEGYSLLKTEFVQEDGNYFLRVYIDLLPEEYEKRLTALKLEEETPLPSISLDDCAKVSRRLSKWLDKEDFIEEMYILEVCSKGYLDSVVEEA